MATEMSDGGQAIKFLILLAVAAFFYFLPTIVAGIRKHHQANAIALLNLVLLLPVGVAGFTMVSDVPGLLLVEVLNFGAFALVTGWVIDLIWASTLVRHDLVAAAQAARPLDLVKEQLKQQRQLHKEARSGRWRLGN